MVKSSTSDDAINGEMLQIATPTATNGDPVSEADAQAAVETITAKEKAPLIFEVSPALSGDLDQEILKVILMRHQEWKKKVLDPRSASVSGRANFSSAKLRGLSFFSQDVSYANFKNADCLGCDFKESIAVRANFTGANLQNADFRGADIRNAIFDAADLTGTLFD